MSAMHWEARRRQQVLDRRLSDRAKQDEMKRKNEEKSETHSTSAGSNESLEVHKKCICKCQPANEETWAKSNKRYSSLQYSQQW